MNKILKFLIGEINLLKIIFIFLSGYFTLTVKANIAENNSKFDVHNLETWNLISIDDAFAIFVASFYLYGAYIVIKYIVKFGMKDMFIIAFVVIVGNFTEISFLLGPHFNINAVVQFVINLLYDFNMLIVIVIVIAKVESMYFEKLNLYQGKK